MISLTSSLLSAFLVAVAGTALMVGFNMLSVVFRINGLYKKGKMADFTVQYIIDKTGVHARSERGDVDYAWKQILFARETPQAFYLIAAENRAVVIPKGQIANDGELNMIRSLFGKYVATGRAKTGK